MTQVSMVPNNIKVVSVLEGFTPTMELAFFKELVHDKLTDEEILELRIAPELHHEKLAPFRLTRIHEIVSCDSTYLWLVIKDPELVKLEFEKPLYLQKLKDLAMGTDQDSEVGEAPKGAATQLKAIEVLLKQLDKTSMAKKQRSPAKDDPAQLEAKLLKALPKQYAKLSEFELNIQKKQCGELLN